MGSHVALAASKLATQPKVVLKSCLYLPSIGNTGIQCYAQLEITEFHIWHTVGVLETLLHLSPPGDDVGLGWIAVLCLMEA